MGQTRMDREFKELAMVYMVPDKAQYVQSGEHLRLNVTVLEAFHHVLQCFDTVEHTYLKYTLFST